MDIDEFKNQWQIQDKKLEKCMQVNSALLKTIHTDKSRNLMRNIMFKRVLEAITFFVIVILLWLYIVNNPVISAATISATLLNLFAIIGLAGNIGQIALIAKIDYADPVCAVQEQIFKIRSHALVVAKLILSSIPFNMAYIFLGASLFFDLDLFVHGERAFLISQAAFSVALIFPTVWIIRKLNVKNIKSKLDRAIINTIAGKQLQMAADVLVEIKE